MKTLFGIFLITSLLSLFACTTQPTITSTTYTHTPSSEGSSTTVTKSTY